MKLYEIADKYRAALDALRVDAETGEVFGTEQIETVSGELDEKLTACIIRLRELDNDSDFCKNEIARLRNIKKSVDGQREWLSRHITECMEGTNKRKIDDPRARAYLRNTERVIVQNGDDLPEKYCRVETVKKPNLTAIKQALKSGEQVSGAYIENGTSLILQRSRGEADEHL